MRDLLSNKSQFIGQLQEDKSFGSALVISSTLQLTSKQWFITQQITARADLCLKQRRFIVDSTS